MRKRTIDRTGQVMGTMVILSFSHHQPKAGNALWKAECNVCGHQSVVQWNARTKSGCKACHGRKQIRHVKYKENTCNDLYMLKCGPYVKIGVTDNIKARLKSIQANCPYPIELIGFWAGEGWREELWHKELSHLHHHGEWFNLDPQLDGSDGYLPGTDFSYKRTKEVYGEQRD